MGLIGSRIGTRRKGSGLLGVDIGTASVKVLELSLCNGGFRVEACALEALPPNAVVEGNISDVERVGEALKQAHARSGSRARRAVLAVGGQAVITRTIDLEASLADSGMLERIVADAGRYVPHPLDEVAIDFEVCGLSEQHPDRVEVMLVACRRNEIEALVGVLRLARLEPAVVEPQAQALERVFQLLGPRLGRHAGEQVVAVADIGAAAATLWVFVDGRAVFSRSQPFGGGELEKALQERHSLPDRQAEDAAGSRDAVGDVAESALEPFREEVAGHLTRALRFFYSSTHYSDVDRILLMGGMAAVRGLAHALQSALQAPAAAIDPFAGMTVSGRVDAQCLAANAPALALCCGLAMRGFA